VNLLVPSVGLSACRPLGLSKYVRERPKQFQLFRGPKHLNIWFRQKGIAIDRRRLARDDEFAIAEGGVDRRTSKVQNGQVTRTGVRATGQ
jgi:hypothetical protein